MISLAGADSWNAFLAQHAEAHLLQTAQWGELKQDFGWQVARLHTSAAGAQVLFRRLPLGLTLAYIPKGPIGDWLPDLLPVLDQLCLQRKAIALKIEPDLEWAAGEELHLEAAGFLPSPHIVQPTRTLVVDLKASEDQTLSNMHQKTRYNIRLAARRGVKVRPWDDLPAFSKMIAATAKRDRFAAHSAAYYQRAYDLFYRAGQCELFVAESANKPLAALMVFARGSRAWYLYGASTTRSRNLMPTYLLQWEAMRWARSRGCQHYDLWGVPDADLEQLESGFSSRQGGLWGVYRFKRGFGGRLVRTVGAWDRPYNRTLYRAYRLLMSGRILG